VISRILILENKEESILKLNEQVKTCQSCPLYKLAKNPVPGDGSADAEIMFIGEGPGEKEDEQGIPFVGAAGKLLDELLLSIGLDRKDVYIANVVKHRPPGNRDPKPEEIQACWPYLTQQIEIIKPKLIVCLGRHSLGRFLPSMGTISQVHGRAFFSKGQAYMTLYHPAVGLYNGGMRPTLFEDFKKIKIALNKINNKK
jgi:DNA polymerase